MASEKIYDVVKVDRVEGRDKPFYSNVGKVIKTDKGYHKLHIPLLGWFDLYEPREESKPAATPTVDDDDRAPF